MEARQPDDHKRSSVDSHTSGCLRVALGGIHLATPNQAQPLIRSGGQDFWKEALRNLTRMQHSPALPGYVFMAFGFLPLQIFRLEVTAFVDDAMHVEGISDNLV